MTQVAAKVLLLTRMNRSASVSPILNVPLHDSKQHVYLQKLDLTTSACWISFSHPAVVGLYKQMSLINKSMIPNVPYIALYQSFSNDSILLNNNRALDCSPESWHIRWCLDWPVAKEILSKDISIFSYGGHVVQLS